MTEGGVNWEKVANVPLLYAGGALMNLDNRKLFRIAGVVSGELEDRPDTMIRYSESDLYQSMAQGRAACVIDSQGELTAFAQYWPYEVENDGDEDFEGKKVFEVGSWLSFGSEQGKGQGTKVFQACLAVGKMLHPDAQFIAIVEKSRTDTARIIEKMGGIRIGEKNTQHVTRNGGSKAEMDIFSMYEPEKNIICSDV